ncbi:MAG: pantothenate kinase [Cyanobacteria bacterium J06638_22]
MDSLDAWLVLAIGNSRLHWALFNGEALQQTWDTPHFSRLAIAYLCQRDRQDDPPPELFHFPYEGIAHLPLWLASVVPQQTTLWENHPNPMRITLNDIPIQGLYPSLGIDRALTLWGAIQQLGSPVLVIDAGTALTFTAADDQQHLLGGAILPGILLQIRVLVEGTAALPLAALPKGASLNRWATQTPDAIRSGVFYGVLATIRDFANDWLGRYPEAAIALTGGDSDRLYTSLQANTPALAERIHLDPHLLFRGAPAIRYGNENRSMA